VSALDELGTINPDDPRPVSQQIANHLRAEPEVEAGPSVRATLASFELALAWGRLDGITDWRQAALAGLRVALRGRLTLRPTHRLASRPEEYVEAALGALVL